ncbi:MAG: LptF/LptG family permease [Planctomycetia bacterium]|nr:LptF/LptG family permease [Planctomycetia bacterium]
MRIIDRYLLMQFVRTFLICWISLTGLYVVVDGFGNLDEFMRFAEHSGRPLYGILGEYYFFRAIFFFDRISAILAMIAAMFTITWIQRHNELTALMAAGISKMRVVRPVICAAALVTLSAAVSREFVIPSMRERLMRDPKDLIGDISAEMSTHVDNESDVILTGAYTQAIAQKIHRPKFVLPPGADLYGKHLKARDAFYRAAENGRPSGYLFREEVAPPELLKHPGLKVGGAAIVLTHHDQPEWIAENECFVVSNVDFMQLSSGGKWRQFMSTPELIDGLHNPSLDYGADVRVMVHSRFVQPLVDVTLLFLGLPLVLRRETRNVYTAIAMCVGITVLFLVVGMACQYLGSIVLIRPSLAAWLPLMIFIPTATAMYERIDR